MIEKIILVKAILADNKEVIPVWDNRLVFNYNRSEDVCYYTIKDNTKKDEKYYELIDCMYNLETKRLSLGSIIDIYPENTEYKIGDIVYVEKGINIISETTVVGNEFYNIHSETILGKEIPDDYLEKTDKTIKPNELYCIRHYQTRYNLANGMKDVSESKIFHKG